MTSPLRKVKSSVRTVARRAAQAVLRARGKRPVQFIHVGKTGGSAIKSALRPHRKHGSYVIILNRHPVRLQDIPAGDRVVFFLRDPLSRFVSGFYSRQRKGMPRHFSPWSPEEELAFGRFTSPNALAVALSSDDTTERLNARKAMKSIEHVRNSYWKWFEDEEYFRSRLNDIFFVGFQETLDADFGKLVEKLGLPADVSLPTDEVSAHRNPAFLDYELDPIAARNLREWYADDFEFIALCRTYLDVIRGGTNT